MQRITCQLLGGYVISDGQVVQEVILSPLSGFAEKMVAVQNRTSTAALVTSLLSQSLCRIGTFDDVSEEMVRRLLVGDRLFLLLKLREITFGANIQAITTCSWPDCGEKVDIDFSTDSIPVIAAPQQSLFHEMRLSEAAGGDTLFFRLPNGEDQEMIAHLVDTDEALATDMLLGRCVAGIGPVRRPGTKYFNTISSSAKAEIEQEMDRLAPKIDLNMEAWCPECQRPFAVVFDLQEFVLAELTTRLDLLLREVHYLAYHYHWSEKEILDMTRENRRRYIEVLSEEMARMNHAL